MATSTITATRKIKQKATAITPPVSANDFRHVGARLCCFRASFGVFLAKFYLFVPLSGGKEIGAFVGDFCWVLKNAPK